METVVVTNQKKPLYFTQHCSNSDKTLKKENYCAVGWKECKSIDCRDYIEKEK